MSKRKLGQIVWVAATILGYADAGSSLPKGRVPLAGEASLREEGPEFLGSFEDEIRKIREEIESETRECFEQLEQQVRQSRWENVNDRSNENRQEGNANANANELSEEISRRWEGNLTQAASVDVSISTPALLPATFIMTKKERSLHAQRKKVVHKTRKPPPTPPTRRSVVSVSGGGLKSVRKKSQHDILEEEKEELVRAKRMLQYELEHVHKVLSRKELYRGILAGSMLVLLCLLTTLALRVVEASLGVP